VSVINVVASNLTPLAADDAASVFAQAGLWLDLTANDTDPNGDRLAVISLGLVGTKGSVTLNPTATNGAYYSAGSAFQSLSAGETATDSFTYTVSDGNGGTDTATVRITVTGVNAAPVARNDTAATDASHSLAINVLTNDTDINAHDTLTVSALNTTGTQGSVTIGLGGVVNYTPGGTLRYLAQGQTTNDHFNYTVADGHGGTATAGVTVTVTGTWLPPTVVANTATTDAAHAVTINVLANDSDPQAGVTLSVVAVDTTNTNGTVVINANGTVT
jgi:VCBS repeat-containing protein